MRKRNCTFLIWVLLLLVESCVDVLPHSVDDNQGLLPVQLSFSLEGEGLTTKADDRITELTEGFRGLEGICLYAFSGEGTEALWPARFLPDITGTQDNAAYSGAGYHSGIVVYNHAHLYPTDLASLPLGTKRVLIYGRSPDVVVNNVVITDESHNGSLIVEGLNAENADVNAIRFLPDPIMPPGAANIAQNIAAALSRIVDAANSIDEQHRAIAYTERGITVTWNSEIADDNLRNCFNEFTGHGQMISGTGSHAEDMLTTVYRQLRDLHTFFVNNHSSEEAHLYAGLCEAILKRFDNDYMHVNPNSPYEVS